MGTKTFSRFFLEPAPFIKDNKGASCLFFALFRPANDAKEISYCLFLQKGMKF